MIAGVYFDIISTFVTIVLSLMSSFDYYFLCYLKEYVSDNVTHIGGWPLPNELFRNKNLNQSPSRWKYKIGAAAVQILEAIRFILFRDDSFTRGQSNMRRFTYEKSATNIHDWSLAYSFICIYMHNIWTIRNLLYPPMIENCFLQLFIYLILLNK